MRLAFHKAGKTSAAAKMHIHRGGLTREIARLWLRTGGKTTQIFASVDSAGSSGSTSSSAGVTADTGQVGGAGNSSGPINIVTSYVTVSVNGGVAPYSYAWTQVSGDPMTATNPSSPSTAFFAGVNPSTTLSAVWQCTVTDAAEVTGSVQVSAKLRNIGGTL